MSIFHKLHLGVHISNYHPLWLCKYCTYESCNVSFAQIHIHSDPPYTNNSNSKSRICSSHAPWLHFNPLPAISTTKNKKRRFTGAASCTTLIVQTLDLQNSSFIFTCKKKNCPWPRNKRPRSYCPAFLHSSGSRVHACLGKINRIKLPQEAVTTAKTPKGTNIGTYCFPSIPIFEVQASFRCFFLLKP